MSILGDILAGKIRQEMKSRVDQVLKAGDDWSRTAKELITALDRLTEAIKSGNPDSSSLEAVARGTKRLAFDTQKLTRAFEAHNKTLEKALTKIEG